jgi:hypothetical protein
MKNWLNEQDLLIRGGRGLIAQKNLLQLIKKPIARQGTIEVASLLRRTGLGEHAVSLMFPYIRTKSRNVMKPSSEELLEYGASLIQIGAEYEALEILQNLNPVLHPQTLLFQSFVHFLHWDISSAVSLLERYVQSPNITEYQRRVGYVNLAAGLVAIDRPCPFLEDLIGSVESEKQYLLLANLLEIRSQDLINSNKLTEAKQILTRATNLLESMGNRDVLFAKRWNAVVDSLQTKSLLSAITDLENVRQVAHSAQQHEVMRDCDLYIALTKKRHGAKSWIETANSLYFGTPFSEFRQRVTHKLNYTPPAQFILQPNLSLGNLKTLKSAPKAVSTPLSVHDYPLHIGNLKSGQVLHFLLLTLLSDLYRPFKMPRLHQAVFPSRYYNPITSPTLLHQALKRLRKSIATARMPLSVIENLGEYRIEFGSPIELSEYCIRHSIVDIELMSWLEKLTQNLESINDEYQFTANQSLEIFGSHVRANQRLLKKACERRLIAKSGKSKQTQYRIIF